VKIIRGYFRGMPNPERVSWGRASNKRWITVVFPDTQTCVLCHGTRGSVVTGRRATITWYQHGLRRMSVSIQKR